MSERPNDLAEGQPDDSAALSEPVPDDAPEAGVVAEADAEPEFEAEAEPEFDGEAFEPEAENVEPEMVTAPVRPMTPAQRRAARSGLAHGQLPIDPALRIKDRASAIFVLVTVGIFAVIFLNALTLGHGGLLTPLPTPTPVPSVTEAPSITAAPSDTPAPSATPAPSITAAPSATPVPSLTPAPSASPAPS